MARIYLYCFTFSALSALAQSPAPDSLTTKALDEVVVTATRTERPMGALPLPVTVITQQQIQQMGSLRLGDVLREQTGLALTTDHGQGLQVQGFGPDYTLILIDGEPLVGRTAGTLDLTRLAVGNIRQIEVVKGPSSSLYGSEALAGVVNIITDGVGKLPAKAGLTVRYGANQTSDVSAEAARNWKKLSVYAFGNRYASAGYDLNTGAAATGATVAPFVNYTGSGRLTYSFSEALKLTVSGRYFAERQDNAFRVNETTQVAGPGTIQDYSLNPVLTHRLSPAWKLTYRFYHTGYRTETELRYVDRAPAGSAVYDANFFTQRFTRPEVVAEHFMGPRQVLTVGLGYVSESVEATRYAGRRTFTTRYGFAQYEWLPTSRWNLIAGGRYDAHSEYAGQFSPKLSARYELTKTLALRGSVGVGFKAPDFRQLSLNFDNAVAGYSVFGTQEVAAGIRRLQQAGQLADILLDTNQLGDIRAERSTAYNVGLQLKPASLPLTLSLNMFRNDIRDLIETQAVARKLNGQNVFSYTNVSRVFTQGAELDVSWQWSLGGGRLTTAGGYQYLVAKDKDVIADIRSGTVFRRDPVTGRSERVRRAEYGGLMNRSRHMANLRFFYEHPRKGVSATLRGIYRGRYGFADRTDNLILDDASEYVRGYVLWNVSAGKTWAVSSRTNLTLQAGVDNLFGYTDPAFIPNLPGRLWFVSLRGNWLARRP